MPADTYSLLTAEERTRFPAAVRAHPKPTVHRRP